MPEILHFSFLHLHCFKVVSIHPANSLRLILIVLVDKRHQCVAEAEPLGPEAFGVVEFAVDLPVGSVTGDRRVQGPLTVAAAEAGDVPLLREIGTQWWDAS